MTCTRCPQPGPHVLIDPDGAHPLCWTHVLQLLADVERVGTRLALSVEPALVVTR